MLLEGDNDPVFVETAAQEVYDVTGAGDTVIGDARRGTGGGGNDAGSCEIWPTHAGRYRRWQGGTATASATELLATFA